MSQPTLTVYTAAGGTPVQGENPSAVRVRHLTVDPISSRYSRSVMEFNSTRRSDSAH